MIRLLACLRWRTALATFTAVSTFVPGAAFQLLAFRVSLLPYIALTCEDVPLSSPQRPSAGGGPSGSSP